MTTNTSSGDLNASALYIHGDCDMDNHNIINKFSLNDDNFPFDVCSSKYFDYNTVESYLIKHKDNLKIFCMNIQSLSSKFDELSGKIIELKGKNLFFDILCFQETWLTDNDNYTFYNIEGYEM